MKSIKKSLPAVCFVLLVSVTAFLQYYCSLPILAPEIDRAPLRVLQGESDADWRLRYPEVDENTGEMLIQTSSPSSPYYHALNDCTYTAVRSRWTAHRIIKAQRYKNSISFLYAFDGTDRLDKAPNRPLEWDSLFAMRFKNKNYLIVSYNHGIADSAQQIGKRDDAFSEAMQHAPQSSGYYVVYEIHGTLGPLPDVEARLAKTRFAAGQMLSIDVRSVMERRFGGFLAIYVLEFIVYFMIGTAVAAIKKSYSARRRLQRANKR